MSADQEPEIASDGVQEVSLTIARRLLTRLIEQAREDDLVSSFTVRGRRRAYLVTPDFYEQAQSDRRMATAFHLAVGEFPLEGDVKEFVERMGQLLMEIEDRAAESADA